MWIIVWQADDSHVMSNIFSKRYKKHAIENVHLPVVIGALRVNRAWNSGLGHHLSRARNAVKVKLLQKQVHNFKFENIHGSGCKCLFSFIDILSYIYLYSVKLLCLSLLCLQNIITMLFVCLLYVISFFFIVFILQFCLFYYFLLYLF